MRSLLELLSRDVSDVDTNPLVDEPGPMYPDERRRLAIFTGGWIAGIASMAATGSWEISMALTVGGVGVAIALVGAFEIYVS